MIKNEKIARYIAEKNPPMVDEVKNILHLFIGNYDEFQKIIDDNDKFSFGNAMRKYERLSTHIALKYGLTWKKGEKLPPALVRNLYKLSRREREAHKLKRHRPPDLDTVFRIYSPDDRDE